MVTNPKLKLTNAMPIQLGPNSRLGAIALVDDSSIEEVCEAIGVFFFFE